MFWLIIGIFLLPMVLIGAFTDSKRRKRANSNPDQHKSSNTDTEPRKHHSMGENIRGG
ncbi:hypothetical protein [Lentibacillus sp. Marseille-P4043]|uniref:hypothetical protein n=1 Tax=Lentibacillus sp. Marseille-P4043 TaxID=2040293 RepID=UPI00131A4C85|nr:hypothetical protein [Lentibacillus sp. Marseille-P4043]